VGELTGWALLHYPSAMNAVFSMPSKAGKNEKSHQNFYQVPQRNVFQAAMLQIVPLI
jgi:hypothetical protein